MLSPSRTTADLESTQRLLKRAADWLWRSDAQFRLVDLTRTQVQAPLDRLEPLFGKTPWDWPGIEAASAAALKDAVARGSAIVGLELALRDRRGLRRCFEILGEPVNDGHGVLTGYLGTARETTRRRRSEQLLALEHTVTRELAEAATSRKVLQAVMRVICEAEQWETSGFFRVIDEQGTTQLEAGWSGPGTVREATDYYKDTSGKKIPPGGMLSQVVATGKPRWVRALRASQTTWEERVRSTGERATLFTPVLVDGRVIGVFAFASRQLREPDRAMLQTMRVIGEQAGQFLKRKRAEQELRESEARFHALTDLSSDWYWETDAQLRITRIDGRRVADGETFPGRGSIGKHLSLADAALQSTGEARTHRDAMEEHRGFQDVLIVHVAAGVRHYVSLGGEPIFDLARRFVGYRGVGRDVTALKQAEQSRLEAVRLQAENHALQESSRLKALFLTNMSHELRTPLNAVIGFSQILKAHAARAGDAKADDYLKKIEAAGNDLLRLIQQLLDFAKIESGRIAFQPEPTRLSTLVDEVLATLDEAIRRRSLQVRCDLDPVIDAISADPLRLKQVLEAYLSNAVKFTSSEGRIVVRTRPARDGYVRIEVEDNGIGIAEGDIPKLFAAFHQLSSGHTKTHPGAGMGLVIAKTLVEAQGGTLGVESTLGAGSIFHFVLPREPSFPH